MNNFLTLLILLLVLIILIVIIHLLNFRQENFLDYNLPFPSTNINNNTNNYQFQNKSPYIHFLQPYEKKNLGWYNWTKNNVSKSCISQQNWNPQFKNFLKMTPLTYDGIWKKLPIGKNYYEWKIQCPSLIKWKKIGTHPQQYWQPSI